MGRDSGKLGPAGSTRVPPPPSAAAAGGGRGLPGQRLCFPRLQLRLRKCCGRGGRRCPAPRDDRRQPGGRDRRGGGSGPGRRPPRGRCTAEDPGPRAAPSHSPGGAQLREARGALSPGCGAAARDAGAASAAGGPERGMSVGWLAPLPGVRRARRARRARRLDAGRVGRATEVAPRSRRATFRPLLLTALVPGLASPPPPSLPTGRTRFGAELENRAPGAALRLLRRRMRPPPPLGLPPSGAAWGTRDPARLGWHSLKSEEVGDAPSPFHHTPFALWLRGVLRPNHCRPEIDSRCWRELEAQRK